MSRIASQKQDIRSATHTPGQTVVFADSSSSSSSASSVVDSALVVVAGVVVVVVVLSFFFLLFFFFVVSSSSTFSVVASFSSSSSFLGGNPDGLGGIDNPSPGIEDPEEDEPPPLFSTQHLILLVGHCTSSSTVSHIRLARACIHLPGHEATLAVFVTDPRSPDRKELNPDPLPGLLRGLEGGGRSALSALSLVSTSTSDSKSTSSSTSTASTTTAGSRRRLHRMLALLTSTFSSLTNPAS